MIHIKGKSFERILTILTCILLGMLLCIQGVLTNKKARSLLNLEDELYGNVLGKEEYLYTHGSISLKLLHLQQCPEIEVLRNGEYVKRFTNKQLTIPVVDGDIIEIEATDIKSTVYINIVESSEGMEEKQHKFKVEPGMGIVRVVKIRYGS